MAQTPDLSVAFFFKHLKPVSQTGQTAPSKTQRLLPMLDQPGDPEGQEVLTVIIHLYTLLYGKQLAVEVALTPPIE